MIISSDSISQNLDQVISSAHALTIVPLLTARFIVLAPLGYEVGKWGDEMEEGKSVMLAHHLTAKDRRRIQACTGAGATSTVTHICSIHLFFNGLPHRF